MRSIQPKLPITAKWIGIAFLTVGCLLLAGTVLNWELTKRKGPLPVAQVDLTEDSAVNTTANRAGSERPVLRLAIAPIVSPEKALESYNLLAEYLGKSLQRRAVLLQGNNYAEVNNLVRYEDCDLAFVCSDAFVQGEREFGMKALAIPRIRGVITYQSYIIVPFDSEYRSLLDLKGKRFGTGDMMSTTGWLYPRSWLRGHGTDPNLFFSTHVITGSHDRSIYAVASGLVDAVAVHSVVYNQMIEKEPSLVRKTRVIDRSPPFGMPPVVVLSKMNPLFQQEIRDVLLHMNNTTEGRAILTQLGYDRFEEPEPGMYDSVRELIDEERRQP